MTLDYKTSITGKLAGVDSTKDVEIAVPLKHLSNFRGTLDMPLINCEVSLILTWSKHCVITSKATRDAVLLKEVILQYLQLIIKKMQHLK